MAAPDGHGEKHQARVAGFLYLLLFTAPIGLLYVPAKLIVRGDATATADNLRASEWLLRLGIASELFHQVVAVFLVLALYRLFKPVDEMLALEAGEVPIVFWLVIWGARTRPTVHRNPPRREPREVFHSGG